jgi:DNA-binding NarL/FixJ family response regulator
VTLIEANRRALPDAIVCDIAMPRFSGFAAATSILATQPDARIVFVTVQESRAVIKKAIDCGARGYALKSDAGNELVAAVRTALEGGFYLSANARRLLGMTERLTPKDKEAS